MNLGLGNLNDLKTQLLAEAVRSGTRYDAQLQAIGSGVAAQFEKHCSRKFGRVADATFICSADREQVYLDRYPVESVDTVELKSDEDTGWETQTNFVMNRNDATGLVYWGGDISLHYAQLRFTFTGGFWFDTSEDGSGTIPVGATALPDDLKLAWYLQCRLVWQGIDKIGKDLITSGSSAKTEAGALSTLALNDQVKEILSGYKRYQLT